MGTKLVQTSQSAFLPMQLLRRSQSSLVLMDMSAELPDLKRTKGLNNWLVRGQNKFYSTWEEATDEAVRSWPLSHHLKSCQGRGVSMVGLSPDPVGAQATKLW